MNDNAAYYITRGYKLYFDTINNITIWIIPEFLENYKNKDNYIDITEV